MSDIAAPPAASGAPRFMLGPLTLYAEVALMEAWLETAAPGEELVYATGPALGRDAPAAVLARQWASEGEVATHQRRTRAGGPLEHFMRRRMPSVGHDGLRGGPRLFGTARRAARPAQTAPADFAETQAGRVFALLVDLAARGQVCPNNRAIAAELDLNTAEQARYAITRLVRAGMIRVDAASTFDPRIITILNTGARTADPSRVPAAAKGK
ncbi:hypothetical protein [Microcystis phage Mae-JY04]|uniref:hypothetical protein n=1 Tax=Blastomonas sp. TaxID=1909299 RepID=UPI002589D561|nr:hypothetical protein [Blastomonas sp.]